MRTKINGAKTLTVGGCMKACHGNEPGTLKEVVSLNTGGPCFPRLGAPNVLIGLGMAGITGSMGQMNKSLTVGPARARAARAQAAQATAREARTQLSHDEQGNSVELVDSADARWAMQHDRTGGSCAAPFRRAA
ncbi:PAAR-like domain-containing protein [Sorangium sp. So ce1128]